MLRYAITDRSTLAATETERRQSLLAQAARWAIQGVAYIQMREKDLPSADLEYLARALSGVIRSTGTNTRLLINSNAEVALAAGAEGVHLTSAPDALTPAEVRALFAHAGRPEPTISISCHTLEDVNRAREQQADLILFGPVFGKTVAGELVVPPLGLEALHAACLAAGDIPVLALGGVTPANTPDCLAAGAAGAAGIRLYSSNG
ncbi:MAG TPA: thiamine phosphate synthase [Acidobacteriaceae bacterium]